MKKIILTIAFIASGMVASAQVGIGNEDPKSTLDITKSSVGTGLVADAVSSKAVDGITIPVVSTDMTTTTIEGANISQMVYSTFLTKEGFYFWDGTKWSSLIPAAAQTPLFTSRINQALIASYDWTNGGVGLVDFYEFKTGTAAITLPNPADYAGKFIHVRNNTGNSVSFGNGDGVGRPRGLPTLVASGAVKIWSDGEFWHNIAGRL